MDVLSPDQRRLCMSRNRGRNTGPELLLRRALWGAGTRFRVRSRLIGRPDVVFTGARIVVFVDGCFWHGCPNHCVMPQTNGEFWRTKIQLNKHRDQKVTASLKADGWLVIRVWEHDVDRQLPAIVRRICRTVSRRRTRRQRLLPTR